MAFLKFLVVRSILVVVCTGTAQIYFHMIKLCDKFNEIAQFYSLTNKAVYSSYNLDNDCIDFHGH